MTDPVLAPLPDAEVPQVREIPPAPLRSDAIDPDVWTAMAEARLAAEPLRDADMNELAYFINRCAIACNNGAQEAFARAQTAAERAEAAGAAANDAMAAAENLADLDELWLGALPTDPTTGKNGAPLVYGNAYINSLTGYLRAYGPAGWVEGVSAVSGVSSVAGLSGAVSKEKLEQVGFVTQDNLWKTYNVGQIISVLKGIDVPGFIACNGSVYAKSQYPGLSAEIGLIPDIESQIFVYQDSGFGVSNIRAITFGNGVYVAAGDGGKLATSPDGVTWTQQSSGFGASAIRALTFGNGIYVAAGEGGKLATSPDGVTWTQQSSGFGMSSINALAFGNGIYVAATQSATIFTSPDGVSWTQQSSGFGVSAVRALTFGNGIYVAAGEGGKLATSLDGVTWTHRSAALGTITISALAFGGGIYVAGNSDGRFSVSSDGVSWTQSPVALGTSVLCAHFAFGFFALGVGERVALSRDLVSWSFHSPAPASGNINSICGGLDDIVFVGGGGRTFFSPKLSYDGSLFFHVPAIRSDGWFEYLIKS